ncbi:hypothetical protein [Roseibium algae]|uniref:Uncharacterized protein n=1 Tax=Roseibium algae TaxID=3123038 RepID=A0ABU8TNZ7_9HYPH
MTYCHVGHIAEFSGILDFSTLKDYVPVHGIDLYKEADMSKEGVRD